MRLRVLRACASAYCVRVVVVVVFVVFVWFF